MSKASKAMPLSAEAEAKIKQLNQRITELEIMVFGQVTPLKLKCEECSKLAVALLDCGTKNECALCEECIYAGTHSSRLTYFTDDARVRKTAWIMQRLNDECFPLVHLTALEKIIGLFNSSQMAEAEVFEFAAKLYQKHAS